MKSPAENLGDTTFTRTDYLPPRTGRDEFEIRSGQIFRMKLPVQLLSTDFDGTLFAEFENPPVPVALQEQIAWLQARGARWVINTGRDLSSLMESIARARLRVRPDYVVVVEREIYRHHEHRYESVGAWNERCTRDHALLFDEHQPEMKEEAHQIVSKALSTTFPCK